MSSILEEIRQFLPLAVANVETDSEGVCFGGGSWRLRVNTTWRLTENDESVASLEGLIGDEIVDIGFRSREVGMDLIVSTRAGLDFEIISDFPYGEWIFSVWHPEDERRIPFFDLEGPISPDLV